MQGNGKFVCETTDCRAPVRIRLIPSQHEDGVVDLVASVGNDNRYRLGFFNNGELTLSRIDACVANHLGITLTSGTIKINRQGNTH